MEIKEPTTYLFYAEVQLPQEDHSKASRAEAVRRAHEGAWSLLAASLHLLDPERFPVSATDQLPAVEKGVYGKPAFCDRSLPEFSLSHSGSFVVCAVSECGPIGVDIQEMTPWDGYPKMDDIVTRFFHPKEKEYYFSHEDPGKRRRIFYQIFSCKEAYVKLTGLGLSEEFPGFYTLFDEKEMPAGIYMDKSDRALGFPVLTKLPAQDLCGHYSLASCTYRPLPEPELRRVLLNGEEENQ